MNENAVNENVTLAHPLAEFLPPDCERAMMLMSKATMSSLAAHETVEFCGHLDQCGACSTMVHALGESRMRAIESQNGGGDTKT